MQPSSHNWLSDISDMLCNLSNTYAVHTVAERLSDIGKIPARVDDIVSLFGN